MDIYEVIVKDLNRNLEGFSSAKRQSQKTEFAFTVIGQLEVLNSLNNEGLIDFDSLVDDNWKGVDNLLIQDVYDHTNHLKELQKRADIRAWNKKNLS
tara:strand:+ start:1000 stop:1290 length:291 start_codon:yes stop_codon:yes gene_type:complete